MSIDAVLPTLRCPRCVGVLARTGTSVGCDSGHRFDLAKQGYLNLLGSAPPANADTAEMVAARLRFLDGGHYLPIIGAIAELIGPGGPQLWVEAGAGPAWYLARLLAERPEVVGLAGDVSVAAARRAARAHERIGAVVFDTWQPWPVFDNVADVLLAVFAPRNVAEFARVLKPGGRLIVVTPNDDHLASLRASHRLLDVPADKTGRLGEALAGSFTAIERRKVQAPLMLSADEVADLIGMGPNAFHAAQGHVEATDTELSVTVSAWRRERLPVISRSVQPPAR